MPEKEPQFNQGEAEEKKAEAPENDEDKNWEIRLYNADGTEKKEPKKRILLWGKLKELLENVNLSDEEAKEYAEKFLDLKNKKTSVIIHKFSADVLEYNVIDFPAALLRGVSLNGILWVCQSIFANSTMSVVFFITSFVQLSIAEKCSLNP